MISKSCSCGKQRWRANVSATICRHEDENVFDQTDFGFDEAHGLGDSAILFGADEQEDPADWGVGGDGDAGSDLFSTGGVDAPEWAMTARKKVSVCRVSFIIERMNASLARKQWTNQLAMTILVGG